MQYLAGPTLHFYHWKPYMQMIIIFVNDIDSSEVYNRTET